MESKTTCPDALSCPGTRFGDTQGDPLPAQGMGPPCPVPPLLPGGGAAWTPPRSGGAQAGLYLAAPCKLQVGSLKALSSLLRPFLPQNPGVLGDPSCWVPRAETHSALHPE